MNISSRKIRAILFVAALAGAWLLDGPMLAVAFAGTVTSFIVVRAMQIAGEEIRRIQVDERPDLYSRESYPVWKNSAY